MRIADRHVELLQHRVAREGINVSEAGEQLHGANESGDNFAYPMAEYRRTMLEVLRQGKQAVPDTGCLVIAAMDRAAMGGAGSMPNWVRRGLGQADLTHPSGVGAEVLANWIYRALMQGYDDYLKRGKR